MHIQRFLVVSAALVFIMVRLSAANGAAPAAAPPTELPQFAVTSLSPIEGNGPHVIDINASGTTAGSVLSVAGGIIQFDPFIRPGGGNLQLLPKPAGAGNTSVTDLNDNGWGVGSGAKGAIVWSPGGAIPIGATFAPGRPSSAEAINNRNQVVGYMDTAGRREAYVWDPQTGLTLLGDIPGGSGNFSARAISDAGHVVGDAYLGSSAQHAFLWTPGTGMRDLGDLPGGTEEAAGFGVNSKGHIVGYSISSEGHRPFLWTEEGGMRSLGFLPAHPQNTVARSINDDDWVVGDTLASPEPERRAFLWTPELGMHDLNDLLTPADARWSILGVRWVNDRGQILAEALSAGEYHTVLLSPVPEPAGFVAALFGGAILALKRTKKPLRPEAAIPNRPTL